MTRGIPRQTNLVEYCAFVMSLADLCYREAENGLPRKDLHIWYLYRQAFYGLYGYLAPSLRTMASERAVKEFNSLHLGRDIRDFDWTQQLEFDESRQYGRFHLEHVYSGEMFRADAEKILSCANRVSNLADIVLKNFCVAWITKEENAKLGRKNRGDNLESALQHYRNCGIVLLENETTL